MFDRIEQPVRGDGKKQAADGGEHEATPAEQSGQFEGVGREMRRASNLPSGDAVASPVQTRQDLANDDHA